MALARAANVELQKGSSETNGWRDPDYFFIWRSCKSSFADELVTEAIVLWMNIQWLVFFWQPPAYIVMH